MQAKETMKKIENGDIAKIWMDIQSVFQLASSKAITQGECFKMFNAQRAKLGFPGMSAEDFALNFTSKPKEPQPYPKEAPVKTEAK